MAMNLANISYDRTFPNTEQLFSALNGTLFWCLAILNEGMCQYALSPILIHAWIRPWN